MARRQRQMCIRDRLLGSTPKVPGLALKQMPDTFLFKSNPQIIWDNL